MRTSGQARARRLTGGHAVAAVVFALLGCGKTVATLSYQSIGTTEEVPLALAEGTEVKLAVRAEKYSYSGRNHVILEAALLQGGAVVEKMSCEGFEFEGGAGSGCKSTHYNAACSMTVPKGGADTVRVGTRMENHNSATIEGLQVLVQQ